MPSFFLDASAVVKRYRTELGSDVVDALLESVPTDGPLVGSFLTVLETTAAGRRSKGSRWQDAAVARVILSLFRHDMSANFRLWPLDSAIVAAALSVVEQHRLRAGDALQLASALAFGAVYETPIIMVSSDHELLWAAAAAGLSVLDPTDHGALQTLRELRSLSQS